MKESLDALIVLEDESWHQAQIPPESLELMYKCQRRGETFRGNIFLPNARRFAEGETLRMKDILIKQATGLAIDNGKK